MCRTLIAAAMLGLIATASLAQQGPMHPLRQLQLTTEDVAALQEASNQLTQEDQVGETGEWANPSSGNSGTVTLLELFEEDGYDCRRVRHVLRIKDQADPKQLQFKTCLDTDGVWKFK